MKKRAINRLNQSYWLRSGFYTLLENLSVLVLSFGVVALLFRSLSKAEFGVWVLYLTFCAILQMTRIGLIKNALIKYLATCEEKDYGKINTASLALNGIITSGMVAILWGFAIPLSHLFKAGQLVGLLHIYSLTTILLIPFFQFNFIQQAKLDFKGIFWANFTKQGLMFGIILALFVAQWKITLFQLAVFQVVTAVVGSCVSFAFARKYLRFSKELDWVWMKKLFHFGKYVFGTNLSTMLYKSIDKMMLGIIPGAGAIAVALYEAALKITNLTDVPTSSMANILFPQSALRMKEGKEEVKKLYEKAVGAILAVLLPCILFVLVCAEWIIRILAGPEYLEAANLLRLTILYGLFIPFAVQFGTVLDSIGKPKTNFYFTLLSVFLNIVFNYFFIMRYGLFGAAYGTLTSYAITFIIMQILLYKQLNVKAYNAFGYQFQFYKKSIKLVLNYFQNRKTQTSTLPENGLASKSLPAEKMTL